MIFRTIIAVVLAGVIGVLVAVSAGMAFISPEFALLVIFAPELFLFGILLPAIVPFVDRTLPEARGTALVVYPLTLGAVAAIAVLRLGDPGDFRVLALSLVYATTAVLIYRLARVSEAPSGPPAQR